MPRLTLPASLKHLRTYEVYLTITTEDELWSHFKEMYAIYDTRMDIYYERVHSMVKYLMKENPYKGKSWRKEPPEHLNLDYECWFGTNEGEQKEYSRFQWLMYDLEMCDKEFGWSKRDDYFESYANMLFTAKKYRELIREEEDDIKRWEKSRYLEAKKDWIARDREWIEEDEKYQKHLSSHHKTKSWWENEMKCNPAMASSYHMKDFDISQVPENYADTCKWCAARKPIVHVVEVEETSTPTQLVEVKPKKHTLLTCSDCGISTSSKMSMEIHLNSRDHKRTVTIKSRFCDICNIQSRTDMEYQTHCNSQKHIKKVKDDQAQQTQPVEQSQSVQE